ncbi:MAG: hypothetical protein ACI8XO_003394 [Verrucomicrobiales bacterium]|jgi:hypothetical protein
MRLLPIFLLVFVASAQAAKIEFNRDVRPILSNNCFYCHGPDENHRKADLRLDNRAGAIEERKGDRAIDPTALSDSELIHRILSTDEDEMMPPPETHHKLTAAEKQTLKEWVEQGAEYQDHWSFIAPEKSPVPQNGAAHPIDAFLLEQVKSAGLGPLPAASKETLIRRVSLDLTGLPPTPAEVDAFVADPSPDAYGKLVDRLLASPHYGERMTLDWMDAARYGDSSVMHADGPRDMWPWRDWVIKAYNDNMPFDQFTIEQLAGDLLPDATNQQKIASGFNRNHATSDEGGAIPEELRVSYVVDRVKTTSTVWLALSMECAQCHDHKYDPISQKDYYKFFAYFNNTTDPGMQSRNGNQAPVVTVVSTQAQVAIDAAAKRHQEAIAKLDAHKKAADPAFQAWLAEAEKNASSQRPEPTGLTHQFPLTERKGKQISNAVTKAKGNGSKLTPVKRDTLDRGLKFDGKTSYAFDKHPPLERDQAFTFSSWLKLPQSSSGSVLARMDVSKDYRGYDLWVQGRSIGTHIISAWPSNAIKVVSTEELTANRWHHVSLSYDGSSTPEGIKIYIDGKLTTNKVEQNSLNGSIATDTPFRIGSRSQGGHFNGEADDIRIYDHVLNQDEIASLGGNPIAAILATAKDKRTPEQREQLLSYYLNTSDKMFQSLTAAVGKLGTTEKNLRDQNKVTSMIMQDEVNKPRMTYVLDRGQYDSPIKDEIIPIGVPAALGALPGGAPANRLGLAQWLTRPDHPLTARVAVNRLWTTFFGTGLVKTSGDFGNQGEWPSHPQLLDWLAVDFVENGWDTKHAIKQIVTSEAYKRNSATTPELLERDPENRLLARGPRFRLHAEFIRDNALAISGLLVPKVGGPGVKPYQPANIWNEVSLNGGLRYKRDSGEKLYRRAMYTYWKRSAPLPSMLIFDVPTREMCAVQRPRTNTPLQALVTLNDPQFVEAARALAQRLIKEAATTEARIDLAFRLATARHPNAREIEILKNTLATQTEIFKSDQTKAEEFLKVGESKRDESIDKTEHAAWSVISQMILNLDETVTRG